MDYKRFLKGKSLSQFVFELSELNQEEIKKIAEGLRAEEQEKPPTIIKSVPASCPSPKIRSWR